MSELSTHKKVLADLFAQYEKRKTMSPAEYRNYLITQSNEIHLNRQAEQIVGSIHIPKDNKLQGLTRDIAKWMLSQTDEDLQRPWKLEDIRLQFPGHDPGTLGKALRALGWLRTRRGDTTNKRPDFLHRWHPPGAHPDLKPQLTVDALREHLGARPAPVKVDVLRKEFTGQDGRPPTRSAVTECLRELGFEFRRDALSLRWWAPRDMAPEKFHQFTYPGTRAPNRPRNSRQP